MALQNLTAARSPQDSGLQTSPIPHQSGSSRNHWVMKSPSDVEINVGPQGQRLIPVINDNTAGSTGISEGYVVMPPLGISEPHLHNGHEIVVGTIEGLAFTLIGEELEPIMHRPFQRLFVGKGVPHVAVNISSTKPVIAQECQSCATFNKDVELLPHLKERAAAKAEELRAEFANEPIPTTLTDEWRTELLGKWAHRTHW